MKMGFGKFIRNGVGLIGKTALGVADTYTGGLASKIAKGSVKFLNRNAGTIGKVARTIGKNFLSDETRNKLTDYTRAAIKYMPEGKVRTALNKISQAAQGKKVKQHKNLLTPEEMKAAVKNPAAFKAKQAKLAEHEKAVQQKHAERKQRHEERRAAKLNGGSSKTTPTTAPGNEKTKSNQVFL